MKKLLLILIVVLPLKLYAQVGLDPTGIIKAYAPLVTLSNNNTTPASILGTTKDTIKAKTLVSLTRPYHCTLWCTLTTPTVSLPTLTLSMSIGGSSMTLSNAAGLVGSNTTAPIVIDVYVFPVTTSMQYVVATVYQTGGTVLTLTNANTSQFVQMSLDPTVDIPIDFFATYGGLTVLGNTTLMSRVFFKHSY